MSILAAFPGFANPIPEHIARLLGQEIISSRLAPSTRLTEEEVAASYGVSRSPVREALRLLERDGLVRRSARRGIWVAPLSLADFDEVYSCRVALEGVAAEGAAKSPDAAASREHFNRLLRRLRAAQFAGDSTALFEADVEGSDLIYSLAANLTLRRLLGTLEKQALRYRYFAYAQSPKIVQLSVETTAQIYDLICQGEAEPARELTEGLIRDIWRAIRPIVADGCAEEPAE